MTTAPYTLPVLDHGFVQLCNVAGPKRRYFYYEDESKGGRNLRPFDADDTDPANAARMSFNQMDSNRARVDDLKLCDFLMRNWHTSPFEMIEVWVEMKLPIFVARQFVRHRTVSINEVSGRYVQLPAEWYIPKVVGGKAPNKKQGQEDNLNEFTQDQFKQLLDELCAQSYRGYEASLKCGVAPEHARLLLHLNHYTHWLWKQDLHNLMNFLRLRDHSHAQIEAQAYAQAVDKLVRQQLPESMALYDKYRRLP